MLPKPQANPQPTDYPGLSVQQLDDWRQDQLSWLQWRYDSAIEEEYVDNNQFSSDDKNAMLANGIPLVTINRIQHQVNSVIGLQESNMTDWKLRTEDVNQQDGVQALNVQLHKVERTSKADRSCLDAAKSAFKAGIGWVEVGRNRDPFKPGIQVRRRPWREMYWDYRGQELDCSDWTHVRRVKFFHIDRLLLAFKNSREAILRSSWSADSQLMWIEPDRQYRQYDTNNWRDIPLSWNYGVTAQKYTRLLEEVWYQVQVEGWVVKLSNGKVMEAAKAVANPMVQLMLRYGEAEYSFEQYAKWRQSFWINNIRLLDRWSPHSFDGPPYVPFWCHREEMTGVPYGGVRVMRSIQDAINTMEAKILFSINAKQTKVKMGATDIEALKTQVGRKNGIIVVNQGYSLNDVQIDEHIALNDQHFKLYQDLIQQIETVGGTAGLNPSAMATGKPRSGVQSSQMMMQAMSTLGEFSSNYRESRTLVGYKVLELLREDIAKRGNMNIEVKQRSGATNQVMLHRKLPDTVDGMNLISNDVTIMQADIELDDVPHTATYRAAQFELIANVLQSMPPEQAQLRAVMLAELIECSDLPGAVEKAQMIREHAGLVPPQTPQAQAQAAAQQKDMQEQKDLARRNALAQIGKHEAQAFKLRAEGQRALTQAQQPAEGQGDDQLSTAERQVQLDKHHAQVGQIQAKTAKTLQEVNKGNQPPPAPPENW